MYSLRDNCNFLLYFIVMPIVSKAIILHETIRISEPAKCLKRNDKKNTAIPNVKSMLINMVKNLNCLSLNIFGNSLYGPNFFNDTNNSFNNSL